MISISLNGAAAVAAEIRFDLNKQLLERAIFAVSAKHRFRQNCPSGNYRFLPNADWQIELWLGRRAEMGTEPIERSNNVQCCVRLKILGVSASNRKSKKRGQQQQQQEE